MADREGGVIARWAAEYQLEAEADDYRVVIGELKEDGWGPFEEGSEQWTEMARKRVQGTIECVAYLLACRQIDGVAHDHAAFLRKQVYDPSATTSRYRFAFVRSRGDGIVFVDELIEVDLADLFNGPGYYELRITHADDSPFEDEELDTIEKWIEEDFRYDFEPDEFSYELERSEHCVQLFELRET